MESSDPTSTAHAAREPEPDTAMELSLASSMRSSQESLDDAEAVPEKIEIIHQTTNLESTDTRGQVDDSDRGAKSDPSLANSEAPQYTPPSFDVTPSLAHVSYFNAFTKGVKWARNGSYFAVVTDDNQIHMGRTTDNLSRYHVPDEVVTETVVTVREPQPINDFAWHPSHDLNCFVTTCNTQPLHLYEAATGKLQCSYTAKNHLDELVAAYSVQFMKSGERVCAGYKKFVRVFEVDYPGRSTEVSTWKQYQAGIVSALDIGGENLLAVGTYCNNVALYDLRSGQKTHEPVIGHSGGITQLRVSFDGTLLYSGARKDNSIQCRDLRKFEEVVLEFPRVCTTNQRMHFDLPYEEDFLCTGNTDGSCYLWNLRDLKMYDENKCQPNLIFLPHTNLEKTKSSAANGISFHPWAPMLASSSGGRPTTIWDDEREQCVWTEQPERSVKFWKFPG